MNTITTLRRLLLAAFAAAILLPLASCEDEMIASDLEGAWEGNMSMSSIYGGHVYNSSYSCIEFSLSPFRFTRGTGYWVDYYSNAPYDYIASHIDWRVKNGIIEVYFVEDDYTIYIEDYRLAYGRFTGVIYLDEADWHFDLVQVDSPNWSGYEYNRYYHGGYYRAPAKNGAAVTERPKRLFNPQK